MRGCGALGGVVGPPVGGWGAPVGASGPRGGVGGYFGPAPGGLGASLWAPRHPVGFGGCSMVIWGAPCVIPGIQWGFGGTRW